MTPAVEMTTPGATEAPPPAEIDQLTSEPAAPASEPADPAATAPESVAAPTAESTTTLAPVERPEPQGGPWTSLDLTLRSGSDVIRETDLPQSLRDFLVTRIGVEDETGCLTEEITLHGIHQDGYVYGTEESTCGGGQAVWGIADNQWNYVVQFGDAMPCDDLAQNGIPTGAPGLRCTEADGAAKDY